MMWCTDPPSRSAEPVLPALGERQASAVTSQTPAPRDSARPESARGRRHMILRLSRQEYESYVTRNRSPAFAVPAAVNEKFRSRAAAANAPQRSHSTYTTAVTSNASPMPLEKTPMPLGVRGGTTQKPPLAASPAPPAPPQHSPQQHSPLAPHTSPPQVSSSLPPPEARTAEPEPVVPPPEARPPEPEPAPPPPPPPREELPPVPAPPVPSPPVEPPSEPELPSTKHVHILEEPAKETVTAAPTPAVKKAPPSAAAGLEPERASLRRRPPGPAASSEPKTDDGRTAQPTAKVAAAKAKLTAKPKTKPATGIKFGGAVAKAQTAAGLRTRDKDKMVDNASPANEAMVYTACNFVRCSAVTDVLENPAAAGRDQVFTFFLFLYATQLAQEGLNTPVETAVAHAQQLSAGQIVTPKAKKEAELVKFIAKSVAGALVKGLLNDDKPGALEAISNCHCMLGEKPENLQARLGWVEGSVALWSWERAARMLWEEDVAVGRAKLDLLVDAMANTQRQPTDASALSVMHQLEAFLFDKCTDTA